MASSNKIIKANLPSSFLTKAKSAEQLMLVQPTAVTFMRYDYSLMQSKIFVRIIFSLQSAIQEAIYNYYNHVNSELTLFSDKDFNDFDDPSCITLKIPINSFGVNKTQYKQLKEALRTLVSIPVETPVRDKNQKVWRELDNLCSVRIPEDGRTTHVYIKIKRTTANMLLNMDFGFTRFFQEVILSATNAYTPRFYLYLSAFLNDGGCKIKVEELRKYLRLQDQYKVWKDFIKRVLTPVEKELKDKYKTGKSNFFFEYEKFYNQGRRKYGEPDMLIFKIISANSTALEKESLDIKRKQIYNLLRSNYVLMEEKFAHEISEKVTVKNHMSILLKISELTEVIAKPNNGIIHKGPYVYSSIKKLIEETEIEESPKEVV